MLIFLDTETTGLEVEDRVCSIGLIAVDKEDTQVLYELVNEGKKLSPKASSINHLTNEMLKNKKPFKESEVYKFLEKHNNQESVLIAHNTTFDLEKLAASGFDFKGTVIDTLRVTKHLIPECEFFSLQILRYELRLYKRETDEAAKCGIKDAIVAHNALSDALVTKILFEYLLEMVSIEKMSELSFQKVLLSKFSFGKYQGKYIEEVSFNDRAYLEWLLRLDDLDEDLRYSVEYYL